MTELGMSIDKLIFAYFWFVGAGNEFTPPHKVSFPTLHLKNIRLMIVSLKNYLSVMIHNFYVVVISVWLKIRVLQGSKVLRKPIQACVLASARVGCFHVNNSDAKTPANGKLTNVNLSNDTSMRFWKWFVEIERPPPGFFFSHLRNQTFCTARVSVTSVKWLVGHVSFLTLLLKVKKQDHPKQW